MITFTPSLSERKRILKQVCKKNPRWTVKIAISTILFMLAVGIMVGSIAMLIFCHAISEAVYIFAMTVMCLALIPIILGIGIKNMAKYKCGLPYSSYANGTLILKDDSLEYVFWSVGHGEAAAYSSKHAVYCEERKSIYSIPKLGIMDISIEDNICMITGKGKIQMQKSEIEDEDGEEYCDTFGFILAFEQSDAGKTIKQWWGWDRRI